jgi:hypothetical protein
MYGNIANLGSTHHHHHPCQHRPLGLTQKLMKLYFLTHIQSGQKIEKKIAQFLEMQPKL